MHSETMIYGHARVSTAPQDESSVFAILGIAAKRGRHCILERTARGRADAKERGVKFGRGSILTLYQQKGRKRLEAGETQRSVARSYNVSQSTISRSTPAS